MQNNDAAHIMGALLVYLAQESVVECCHGCTLVPLT
jgi:hypothetical protein